MSSSLKSRLSPLVLLAVAGSACAPDVTEPGGYGYPAAAVASTSFVDEFDAWDPSRWIAGDHPLGNSMLRPSNVSVAGGVLLLRTPAGTRDGAEVRSVDRYTSGSFTAHMQCGLPVGALCAFFLYEYVPGNRNDEIDMEILAGTRRMMMTTWSRGRQTNHAEIDLPFDPAAGIHAYVIEWSAGRVRFLVDGVAVRTFTRRLPSRPMYIFANAWWPTWLTGTPPTAEAYLSIDRISAAP